MAPSEKSLDEVESKRAQQNVEFARQTSTDEESHQELPVSRSWKQNFENNYSKQLLADVPGNSR